MSLVFETTIQPRNHAVLIKPIHQPNTYKGLIHLPDRSAGADNTGIVVRTGHLVRSVHIGEWVLFNWRQGIQVDDDFIVLDERALIAVLAEPKEVLISVGIMCCDDYHRHCDKCSMMFAGLKAVSQISVEAINKRAIDFPKNIRKYEVVVAMHRDYIYDFALGYAYAYGLRTYSYVVYGMGMGKIITAILDMRKIEEEADAIPAGSPEA